MAACECFIVCLLFAPNDVHLLTDVNKLIIIHYVFRQWLVIGMSFNATFSHDVYFLHNSLPRENPSANGSPIDTM